ncbi:hypothetical protein LPJ64_003379 [Coemansia asiatica]|uniref:ATP-dependent RNA helicase n=1 Tax=Coemansia asiatica TaxID=1052880 RepID=A0A9W7XL90_9FUNG|nr:hypothetical protein LPJ64_003379 [Coemansia asiatica]
MLSRRNNILVRQTTGTGKTLGLVIALLSYSLQPSSNTAVLVVPNRELALQIEGWADKLLQRAYPEIKPRYRVLQRFVSGSPYESEQKRVLKRHGLPKIVVGTPRCLLEMAPVFDDVLVDTVVVDEIDAVLKLPGKYASTKQVLLRKEKPAPGQLFIEHLLGIDTGMINQREIIEGRGMQQVRLKKVRLDRSKIKKKDEAKEENGGGGGGGSVVVRELGRRREVQLVVSSATANHRLRNLIGARQWVSKPLVVLRDTEAIGMPSDTQHFCLVIDNEESIRNIAPRIVSDDENHQDDLVVSSYARYQERKKQADKQNPWVSDVMRRSSEQQATVMQLMAEVASNVLQAIQPRGTTILFVRSDANSRQFADVLRSYGVVARDIMTRYSDQPADGGEEAGIVYLATEEAARGIDIPDTELVLILDVPKSISSYVHLSGRTGRFGRTGKVLTVVPVGRHGWYESKMQAIFGSLQITPQNAPFVE